MKISDFLSDKLYVLLTALIICLLLTMFLLSLHISASVLALLMIFYWILPITFLCVEYTRRKGYYQSIHDTMKTLDQKYLIADVIRQPHFADGRVLYEIIHEAGRSMQENVKRYRIAENEYKDYIEMWVHEIKTPLAAAKLIADNNPSEASASISEEIDHVQRFVEQALFYARSANVENDYIIKELSLAPIVHNVVRKHSSDFIYRRIRIELEDLEKSVYTDQKWIEFILDQILTNALNYTPSDTGVIRIYATSGDNPAQAASSRTTVSASIPRTSGVSSRRASPEATACTMKRRPASASIYAASCVKSCIWTSMWSPFCIRERR